MKMKVTVYACALAISLLAACASDGDKPKESQANTPTRAEPARPPAACSDCAKPASKPAGDGNLSWRQGKEQDLAEARGFASRAQAQKLPLSIVVTRVQKRDEASGKTEQIDAVKNVVLRPLPLDKIRASDKVWAEAIRELGKHAAQASAHETQQIVVSVTASIKPRVTQWLNEGIASANNNQKPDVQVFEAKQAKDTAIFYQPLDQKQFN
ncbi:MAG: hypothetical protein JWL63_1181 [Rhodocyclales bacterium]|nr:hypothetical protein [Rhodocyclales bacterium]